MAVCQDAVLLAAAFQILEFRQQLRTGAAACNFTVVTIPDERLELDLAPGAPEEPSLSTYFLNWFSKVLPGCHHCRVASPAISAGSDTVSMCANVPWTVTIFAIEPP